MITWLDLQCISELSLRGCPLASVWGFRTGASAEPGCWSSFSDGLGLTEWEVQSSQTGCGDDHPPSSFPPYQHRAGLQLRASASGEDRGALLHPDLRLSVSRFVNATGPNPGESAGVGLLPFYSACWSHYYTILSHGSLRDLSGCVVHKLVLRNRYFLWINITNYQRSEWIKSCAAVDVSLFVLWSQARGFLWT